MKSSAFTDLMITKDGDFYLSNSNDMYSVRGIDAIRQAIYLRLKTELEDCKLWEDFGQGLREIKGKRFIKKNINLLKTKIHFALIYGGLFDIIYIEVIPAKDTSVDVYCRATTDDLISYKFSFSFDFNSTYMSDINFQIYEGV